jgi:alkanesulfonate monooxygenase SsuD/methylene tetrahydromethanopterin reductase-like flavin-dependent oxidoreductase (luciferase family)
VAGEDRREVSNAGVDPGTRGRRLDKALPLVRRLLAGEEVSHQGEFFTLEEARILPALQPAIRWSSAAKGNPRSGRRVGRGRDRRRRGSP